MWETWSDLTLGVGIALICRGHASNTDHSAAVFLMIAQLLRPNTCPLCKKHILNICKIAYLLPEMFIPGEFLSVE